MGDNLDGMTDAMPVHNVQVDSFFMDKYEVTKELWQSVQTWGNANGYSIGGGAFNGINHPIHSVTWYDAVKWCNARSQKEGLTPCYYTDAAQTVIHKSGNVNLDSAWVKWSANGHRLPTEAEWEKAARGGASGLRYPWGNTISHSEANYYSANSYGYDVSPTRGHHPTYGANTAPVGSFPPNSYGLFDTVGNMGELVWDRYSYSYYGTTDSLINPKGPTEPFDRITRGYLEHSPNDSYYSRVVFRGAVASPSYSSIYRGFRTVRR
jgi:formylglycine-generating enzyme required for sulfatase activity